MPKIALLPTFQGFEKNAFDFFAKLRRNNNRPWFLRYKAEFEQTLILPMRTFAETLALSLHERGLPLQPSVKSPVSRIYRDLRFTPDKSPYNTFISTALFRRGDKSLPGVVYVHLSASESFAAAGFWQPEPPFLQSWRSAMASKPKRFQNVLAHLKRKQLQLNSENALKRLPRGYESLASSALRPYFLLKSFVVSKPLSEKDKSSPDLIKIVTDFGVAAKPLLDFGWSLAAKATRADHLGML